MLLLIVDRKRYGLLEHAEALRFYYCKTTNDSAIILKHKNLDSDFGSSFSFFSLIKQLYRNRPKSCVVWSVGITYLYLPLLSLIFNKTKFIVVVHEPGGFYQRINKGDSLSYSIVTSFYELLLKFSRVQLVTPNIKNAIKYNLAYAPLLFLERFVNENKLIQKSIVFLGRRSKNRCNDFFIDDSLISFTKLLKGNYYLKFFPSKELFTTRDKTEQMRSAICVLNMYLVDHNQSGVTPDSLSYGIPVIITEKDAFVNLIENYSAGVVLNSKEINHDLVLNAVNKISFNINEYMRGAQILFVNEFGLNAFKKYWIYIIN
jgi:hypothetical protein